MSAAVHKQLADHAGDTALADRTLAALAAAAYKDFPKPLPAGWDVLLSRTDEPGGYDGMVVHHRASRTLAVANRGTEFTSLKDWRQNLRAVTLARAGTQIPAACQIVRDGVAEAASRNLPVEQVVFTGHSLGGGLAEAQGRLALSLLPDGLKDAARTVGVASPGFGRAIQAYAQANHLQLHPDPAAVITHYIRKRDVVPNHVGRVSLGRDVLLASIFQVGQGTGVRDNIPYWFPDVDLLANHSSSLHVEHWDVPGDRHLWFSRGAKSYDPRDGERPGWRRRAGRPHDW